MSHFAVAVVTDKLDENELAKKLQPYHEFECTGASDEYVIDVDKTEEARAEYEGYTRTKWKDADGNLHEPTKDEFYRDMTPEEEKKIKPSGQGLGNGYSWASKDWGDGKGYRSKLRMTPEELGMTKVEIPAPEIMSFGEFLSWYYGMEEDRFVTDESEIDLDETHKYGYVLIRKIEGRKVRLDDKYADYEVVKYVDRTNPNAKWDWWVVGGRYSGRLRIKADAEGTAMASKDHGAFGKDPDSVAGGLDYVRIGDIDFGAMLEANKECARRSFESALKRIIDRKAKDGITVDRDSVMQDYRDFCAAKDAITEDVLRAYRNDESRDEDESFSVWHEKKYGPSADAVTYDRTSYTSWLSWELGSFKSFNIEDYLTNTKALSAFAFVDLDGSWNEKGSMGWWGIVSDEKGDQDWDATFQAWVDNLVTNHPDNYLAIVDCHC